MRLKYGKIAAFFSLLGGPAKKTDCIGVVSGEDLFFPKLKLNQLPGVSCYSGGVISFSKLKGQLGKRRPAWPFLW
jgi:hypothetical protein